MDRELRVMEGGYELAELLYNYDHPTSGKVKIKINRIYDLDDDMKSFYPLYEYETYFHHAAFKSLDELKSFEETFEAEIQSQDDLEDWITTCENRETKKMQNHIFYHLMVLKSSYPELFNNKL